MLIAEVEKYMNFSNKNEDAIVPEKFKTVYEIEQKVKPLLQIQKWEQMPDFIKGIEESKKENYLLAIESFKKASNLGNGLADLWIAYHYQLGSGVEKDIDSALKWYKLGAQKGCAQAANDIGYLYYEGKDVAKDYLEAMKWLQLASKKGLSRASNNIGVMYFFGQGVTQSYKEAMQWIKKGVDLGDSYSMMSMGQLYKNGNGVDKSNIEAAKWFLKACEKDNSEACVSLAELYHSNNNPGIIQNFSEAMKYYLKAGKNAQAYMEIGWMYENGQGVVKDINTAVYWYKKAIENGNTWALYGLGKIYKGYDFKNLNAENEAIRYLTLAADKGYKEAMDLLVEIYAFGDRSVKRDRKLEKEWRQKSEAANISK